MKKENLKKKDVRLITWELKVLINMEGMNYWQKVVEYRKMFIDFQGLQMRVRGYSGLYGERLLLEEICYTGQFV